MIARLIAQLESFQWKLQKEQLSALNGRKIARWIQLWKCIDLYVKAIARKRWTQCESHSVGSLSRILRYFAFIEKQPHSTSWTLAVAQIPTIRQNHLGKTKNAKRIKPISRRIVAADWAICFAMSVARASLVHVQQRHSFQWSFSQFQNASLRMLGIPQDTSLKTLNSLNLFTSANQFENC